jgi:hypothetical protein
VFLINSRYPLLFATPFCSERELFTY